MENTLQKHIGDVLEMAEKELSTQEILAVGCRQKGKVMYLRAALNDVRSFMAAAPKMLDALKVIQSHLAEWEGYDSRLTALLMIAEAAIAKVDRSDD